MDRTQLILKAAQYAVVKMISDGSVEFATKDGDEWKKIEWVEVIEALDNEAVISDNGGHYGQE